MPSYEYDLAVSFAGEQREYVEKTVAACKEAGLRVFYDRDKNNEWWGGNFIREQRAVYSSKTQYFVPFISAEYRAKPIPMDEFSAAMMTAVKHGDGYILPVLMDDTGVPSDLLHPTTHYLRAKDYTPDQLAGQLVQRVRASSGTGSPAAEIGPVVEEALQQLRLPRVAHAEWSKYEELDRTFDYLVASFVKGAPQLRSKGFVCTAKQLGDRLMVRVERLGETLFSLDITKGGGFSDDQIAWSIGNRNYSTSSFNGWASPKWDQRRDRSIIEINDFSLMGTRSEENLTDNEGFFMFFWDKMIDALERR